MKSNARRRPPYQPTATLPGCDQLRPVWTTPPRTPPATTAPPLTLTAQVLDTPAAQREAARLAGQLDLTDERTD